MKNINEQLQRTLEREQIIKKAVNKVQKSFYKRQAQANAKITEMQAQKQLEDDYLLDYEV